ncbi:MAG: FAD-dependent oxidoreductase [Pseudomonadota bacterium]
MGQGQPVIARRAVLASAAALALPACEGKREITGALLGASTGRGHLLRDLRAIRDAAQPPTSKQTRVVIAGGGVAGLAAARALRQLGIEDFVMLELEDAAGGNSRGGEIAGIACPLGAHYLPVPGDTAREVQHFLEEAGLRKRVSGRWVYDERYLCHAPQERLFFSGAWQDGLLPLQDVGAATLAQYERFSRLVARAQQQGAYTMPVAVTPPSAAHLGLDAMTFDAWLVRERLDDAHLRWYLDYCCRDDYGTGLHTVSAWAGIHYFASRHGFHAPGSQADTASASEEEHGVLTWPEGNAWLTRKLGDGLGERLRPGHVVTRIREGRHGVTVDAYDAGARTTQRWQAQHCIVALPIFVAERTIESPPALLADRARVMRYAPWAVVNMHLREPLRDRPGAAPSWDNVVYGSRGLGYVDARHQSLDPRPGPTVLSWYAPLAEGERALLLSRSWADWLHVAQAELAQAHPDLRERVTRVEVARYGHAMAIPAPGTLARTAAGLPHSSRLSYAHSDWAGYSVFEEAFTAGHRAAMRVA